MAIKSPDGRRTRVSVCAAGWNARYDQPALPVSRARGMRAQQGKGIVIARRYEGGDRCGDGIGLH